MRPLASGWLAGNAGLGSVTSAGAAGVGAAIPEAGSGSGTPDAFPRPGFKTAQNKRDCTLYAVGWRLALDRGDDCAGPGRSTRAKAERTVSAANGTVGNGHVPVK